MGVVETIAIIGAVAGLGATAATAFSGPPSTGQAPTEIPEVDDTDTLRKQRRTLRPPGSGRASLRIERTRNPGVRIPQ